MDLRNGPEFGQALFLAGVHLSAACLSRDDRVLHEHVAGRSTGNIFREKDGLGKCEEHNHNRNQLQCLGGYLGGLTAIYKHGRCGLPTT